MFWAGEVLMEFMGNAVLVPAEESLGKGRYHAVREQGGISARIIKGGKTKIGDLIKIEVV